MENSFVDLLEDQDNCICELRQAYANERQKRLEAENRTQERDRLIDILEQAFFSERCCRLRAENVNQELKRQILEDHKKKFSSKAERTANALNEELAAEIENALTGLDGVDLADVEEEMKTIEITYTRVVGGSRKEPEGASLSAIVKTLPVLETIREEVERPDCRECGHEMSILGYDERREVVVIPATIGARVYQTPVFVCRECEKKNTLVPIEHFPMQLVRPVERSLAAPETLAWLFSEKIALSVPFYRLEKYAQQLGVPLSRQTMTNWMISAAENWLAPLADCIRRALTEQYIIQADETSFQVLSEPGRARRAKGQAWLFCSPMTVDIRYVFIVYSSSHAAAVPKEILQGFKGWLVSDGYSAYGKLSRERPEIFLSGCWAHCRRKWLAAAQKGAPGSDEVRGLAFITKLFAYERIFQDLTVENRFIARLRYVKPLLDNFKASLQMPADAQSLLGKAITYTTNNWEPLYHFMSDGRLPAANAAAELLARAVAIGRKNYLFCEGVRGADALMAGFSVVETAKANDLNVYKYLCWIFSQFPKDYKLATEAAKPAFTSRIEELAERGRDQIMALMDPQKMPNPAWNRQEFEASIAKIIDEELFLSSKTEAIDLVLSELKLSVGRHFLPEHAPPDCEKQLNDDESESDSQSDIRSAAN